MSQVCPLLFRQIDSTISKISSAAVMIGVVVYLMTLYKLILILLILDFIIRLSRYKSMSPIFQLSNAIQKLMNLPVKMEDAGAKRLAAWFGLFFIIGILMSDLLGSTLGVWIIVGIFMSCVFLDLFFNYCIACKVYSGAKKIFPRGVV